MALQLVVPSLPTRVKRLEVRRWLKQPGDDIAFGDEICELEVREFVSVDRRLHETDGAGAARARGSGTITTATAGVLVMVTASDAGRLLEATALPGAVVEVGSALGRVETTAGDTAPADSGLAFHAVADVVGSREVARRELDRLLTPKQRAARLFRRAVGPDTRLERMLRARLSPPKGQRTRVGVESTSTHTITRRSESLVVESTAEPAPIWGVHLVGACDLPALLEPEPSVIEAVRGTMVLSRSTARISGTRSDMLLQSLETHDPELIAELTEALLLDPEYFAPRAFQPTVEVPDSGLGPVPIAITVLSGAADIIRPAYRHKQSGLIVDPGGHWLDGQTLTNERQRSFRSYLAANFDRVGKLSVDEHIANYRRLLPVLRERTGSEIMVFNVLTIEPGDRTHNYQLRKVPEGARRRQFHIAQAELSEELGYLVVDIDRALKRAQVVGQVDFAHFPREQYPAVAGEAYAALRQAGLL